MIIYCEDWFIVNIVGWQMQIVLKVNHNSNRPKIPYIVDTGYQKRGCYVRNLNYQKFEKRILEIVRQVCRIYANRTMLEETYKKVKDKSIDIITAIKKQIETIDIKIADINKNLDSLYNDKLNGILTDIDFTRISMRFVNERDKLTNENYRYLQFIDILDNKDNIHIEAPNADEILYRIIEECKLDFEKIIKYARETNNKKVLDKLFVLAR